MLRQELSEEQRRARVKNAVAQFLFGALIVPKIFFDARWPARKHVIDILAVDRSGAGEIHIVKANVGSGNPEEALRLLMEIPAHFKYLAFFGNGAFVPSDSRLYASDGMGRIGIIQVWEDSSANLSAHYLVRPERFRLDPSYFREIDRFTNNRPADMEVRP